MTTKTSTERQRAFRARKAAAQLEEVRGIYAPKAAHQAIKQAAKQIAAATKETP